MNKIDLLIGLLIGFMAAIAGCFIFITFFTPYDFVNGFYILKSQGSLGKLITLGSILDLVAFAVLLKLNQELMARGVILAVIIMTILTLFV
ncbi:hypothetical protein [Flavobacterium granuli]|uniref:Uncharacterized protein n=1 Tax=Flavobacterium granuli TaxID=280093 RepID=A0A1M5PKT1_9FLAO|nr:hypothetical protein [Flavobacterium granuli]PRZ26524.1 hypothetical protein BC624_102499 [Flavobacterium granuli]SHH02337.1 hypothetical protein SAMN05443373_10696 [Flavobacterium granuli]